MGERAAYLALAVPNIAFAFAGFFIRQLTSFGMNVFALALVSWLGATAFVFAVAILAKQPVALRHDMRIFRLLIQQGIFFGTTTLMFFYAITHTTIANAEFLQKTVPIWAAVAAVFILHEAFSVRKLLSILVAAAGISLLITLDFSAATFGGDAIALLSAFVFAALIINGRLLKEVSHYTTAFFQFAVAALVALPFAAAQLPSLVTFPFPFWLLMAFFSFVMTAVGLLLIIYGLRRIEASKAALFTLLEPAGAAVVGWIFFRESLGVKALLGIALIISAIVVVVMPVSRRKYKPERGVLPA